MPKTNSTNPLLLASNIKKLEELCDWIENNSDSTIGWDDLTKQSGFTHNELIRFFSLHKQITPMAYIRKVRETKKNLLSNNPQSQLFVNILKK
jgi:transcriptional regulator GlxA family with amidase domain